MLTVVAFNKSVVTGGNFVEENDLTFRALARDANASFSFQQLVRSQSFPAY